MESLPNPVANSGSLAAAAARAPMPHKKLPADLLTIPFENISGWLMAYKGRPAPLVMRAIFIAFRKRHLLSIDDAATMVGVSPATWASWEKGTREIRHAMKRELVRNDWFTPQHFGLSASAQEIGIHPASPVPSKAEEVA